MERQYLLTRIKTRLEAVYGDRLRGVVLYGSEARGDAGPDSDIDVLVLLTGPVALGRELRTIIDALYPLQLEMDRVLEALPVDEADYLRGEYAFYRNVQKEGIHVSQEEAQEAVNRAARILQAVRDASPEPFRNEEG